MQRGVATTVYLLALTFTALAAAPRGETTPGSGTPPRSLRFVEKRQFVVPQVRTIGITFDGESVWISSKGEGEEPPEFHVYDEWGTHLSTMPQEAVFTERGHLDLEWCGTFVWGSQSYQIHAFDPSGTYQGFFNGPIDPCRAVAYDGDYWYVGGWSHRIYRARWNGAWGSTPTWTAMSFGSFSGTNGIAYDPLRDCLWLTDGSGTLYQVGKDGSVLAQLPFLGPYGPPGGCTVMETESLGLVLAVLHTDSRGGDQNHVVFYDISETAVESTTWGSIKARSR